MRPIETAPASCQIIARRGRVLSRVRLCEVIVALGHIMEVLGIIRASRDLIDRRIGEAECAFAEKRPLLVDQGRESGPERRVGAGPAVDDPLAAEIDRVTGIRVGIQRHIRDFSVSR